MVLGFLRNMFSGPSDPTRIRAEQGDAEAQITIAELYWNGASGYPQNHQESLRWYRRAAERGNIEAQFFLTKMQANVGGISANEVRKEIERIRKIAEQGPADAQTALGMIYATGDPMVGGVEQDYEEAMKWLSRASAQGYMRASVLMWVIEAAAQGDRKARSMRFESELAAERENAAPREISLEASWDGEEDMQHLKELARRNRKAAKSGNPEAQLEIGKMHEAGKGAAKDNVRALMWYNIALACGKKSSELATAREAENAYGHLSKKMTETQVRKSSILAHQWLESNPDWWS